MKLFQTLCVIVCMLSVVSCSLEPTVVLKIEQTGGDRWSSEEVRSWLVRYMESGFLSNVKVKPGSGDQFEVKVPESRTVEALELLKAKPSSLTFHLVYTGPKREVVPGYLKVPYKGTPRTDWITSPPSLDVSKGIKKAKNVFGPGGWQISLEFDSKIAPDVLKLTTSNKGKLLAVVLDNEILMAPVINEPFSAGCQITGSFTEAESREVAVGMMRASGPEFKVVP